jgi:hypothetical protein
MKISCKCCFRLQEMNCNAWNGKMYKLCNISEDSQQKHHFNPSYDVNGYYRNFF